MELLDEPTMDKRKNYLFTEITQQLQEMKRWIPKEHLPKLEEVMLSYERLGKELDKPAVMQSQKIMETRLRRTESLIKNELKPEAVFTEETQ